MLRITVEGEHGSGLLTVARVIKESLEGFLEKPDVQIYGEGDPNLMLACTYGHNREHKLDYPPTPLGVVDIVLHNMLSKDSAGKLLVDAQGSSEEGQNQFISVSEVSPINSRIVDVVIGDENRNVVVQCLIKEDCITRIKSKPDNIFCDCFDDTTKYIKHVVLLSVKLHDDGRITATNYREIC